MGGQGLHLRLLDHLGRSSEAKNSRNPKQSKVTEGLNDRLTVRWMDRWTDKAECRVTWLATKKES